MTRKTISCSVKKRQGNLQWDEKEMKWSDTNTGGIHIAWESIKSQMANVVKPGGKILLKITFNQDVVSLGFDSIDDRDIVIKLIKEKQQPALSIQDIQARQACLDQNPEWRRIHRELVMSNLLSEQEFWNSRKDFLQQEQWTQLQKKGTSSVLLSDIKPVDSDGTDVKFTLNSDIIHAIFTQYPGVQKAYLDHVPVKMTEKEFWTLYFSSKYFHRNRVVASKQKDLFEDYMKEVDVVSTETANNRLLDLTMTKEDSIRGNGPDSTMKAGKVKEAIPLIRKFNRHSSLILQRTGSKNFNLSKPSDILVQTNPIPNQDESKQSKKQKTDHEIIQKQTEIKDLMMEPAVPIVSLQIKNGTGYFPNTTVQKSEETSTSFSQMKPRMLSTICFNDMRNTILHDLSKQCEKKEAIVVNNKLVEMIRPIQQSIQELIRHYWASQLQPNRLPPIVNAIQGMKKKLMEMQQDLLPIEREEMKHV